MKLLAGLALAGLGCVLFCAGAPADDVASRAIKHITGNLYRVH